MVQNRFTGDVNLSIEIDGLGTILKLNKNACESRFLAEIGKLKKFLVEFGEFFSKKKVDLDRWPPS